MPQRAVAALSVPLDRAEAQGRYGSVIDLEIVHALAVDRCGDERGAFGHLTRALQLAASHGHLQSFLDEGEPLKSLLRRAVEAGVAPPYGRTVLAATGPARGGGMAGLRESLTRAERRVLARLPSDLTTAEIARELYVAPSTVRSHVKAIYRKLGVGKRGDAVDRARRLGLL
jgi:LuxR family maltose regulon positive regulatory protein